ncbi:MAG: class II fructose-1,6-bisphosphate aldolase [Calditrichia bacterium]
MLVTNKDIQLEAQKKGYAVPAFNTSNLEMTKAIVEVAEELKSPVIIATSTSAISYAGIQEIANIVRGLGQKASVPVSLHLDHGTDFDLIIQCIRNGWTSVMIDASHHPLEENIQATKEIAKIAHAAGVSVEAELGQLAGIEDNIVVDSANAHLTDPEQAKQFVEESNCDTLAVAIGTSHGAYKFAGESNLDFKRLAEIREKVSVPLVLHGASSVYPEWVDRFKRSGGEMKPAHGVSDDHIKTAISHGITKINIDTDLRIAFTTALREFLNENPAQFDPRKILKAPTEALKEIVAGKMKLMGSAGQA